MDPVKLVDTASEKMERIHHRTSKHLAAIQANKVNKESMADVKVNAYNSMTPLVQLAQISGMDAQTLSIEPYDKSLTIAIEHAIRKEKKDYFVRQGKTGNILATAPVLTQERRVKLAKEVQQYTEQAKVQIRQKRADMKKELKDLKKEGVAEDSIKKAESTLQKMTDTWIQAVEKIYSDKEKSLLTV